MKPKQPRPFAAADAETDFCGVAGKHFAAVNGADAQAEQLAQGHQRGNGGKAGNPKTHRIGEIDLVIDRRHPHRKSQNRQRQTQTGRAQADVAARQQRFAVKT